VPHYKEVNPSIYACATFPFLFGIMFGDVGHGGLLFIFASFLVLAEPWLKNTALKPALEMRYILLMMGFFALYCGFLYNDVVSIPLNIWDSCYDFKTGQKIKTKPHCVYPAGIDPVWYVSKQEITFSNSLKMKLAVIFGVCHMTLAIL
jgi:V-type H+-transporting ATPase subunit a